MGSRPERPPLIGNDAEGNPVYGVNTAHAPCPKCGGVVASYTEVGYGWPPSPGAPMLCPCGNILFLDGGFNIAPVSEARVAALTTKQVKVLDTLKGKFGPRVDIYLGPGANLTSTKDCEKCAKLERLPPGENGLKAALWAHLLIDHLDF